MVSNYHIELDGLDYTLFDLQGVHGRMHQLFDSEIIKELNEV
ncbi:hypothetical protein OU798_02090 [Prolixibacteraceae bacterium Z1-6]|uniref:Uncharacterized protein n=1 Tax=Draconibacterium aestuarii TaxID=2998507 RepID=A0A9X3J5Z7_9BACT|nr:hypothetical protein [Prolixibacteraceae bacterium Z1-6]